MCKYELVLVLFILFCGINTQEVGNEEHHAEQVVEGGTNIDNVQPISPTDNNYGTLILYKAFHFTTKLLLQRNTN